MNNRRQRYLNLVMAMAFVAATAATGQAADITIKGNPVTLVGELIAVGDQAPDFTALDGSFKPVKLSDFQGRPVLVSAVPSLDTPVCSLQTKRFNTELAKLPADLVVLTISMDLPFAQQRFCGNEGIEGMVVVSDAARREFGEAYGVLIAERGLLARSIFLIDADGVVRYVQLVPELSQEPDYDAALAAVHKFVK